MIVSCNYTNKIGILVFKICMYNVYIVHIIVILLLFIIYHFMYNNLYTIQNTLKLTINCHTYYSSDIYFFIYNYNN